MRYQIRALAVVLLIGVAIASIGCSAAGTSRLVDRPTAVAAAPDGDTGRLDRRPVSTDWVPTALPVATAETYTATSGATAGRGWDGCCGLPCEAGCGTWHVRGVGGYTFISGEDCPEDGAGYFGADVGYTFPCCLGVDVFWRMTTCLDFDRDVRIPGTIPFRGTDTLSLGLVGVKATYERSFSNGRLFGYAGLGPAFFYTNDALEDDTGFGAFGELGLGYRLGRRWRLRAGVEVAGLYTDVTRTNPIDDGERRWLVLVSPVAQVQFDF